MQRRDDGRRAELRAVGQHHAHDLATAGRRSGRPAPRCGSRRRTTRAAAASAGVTPPMPPRGKPHPADWPPVWSRWWCSITNAGAGAARAGPRADHAGDAEQPAHRVGLEALLDEIGDARGEQAGQVERRAYVDLAQLGERAPACSSQRLGALGPELRRDLVQQRADQRAEPGEPGLPPLVRVGVVRGELADLVAPCVRVVGEREVAAVAARREVRALRVDVVAVLGQAQVAHHLLGEQAHDVRQAGDREVGAEGLLGDRGAADGVPAFQHEHPAAGAGKVSRRRPGRCGRRRR